MARNLHSPPHREDAMAERTERAVLNHLIETCTDAARGFRSAADHVENPTLKGVFLGLASAREKFAADLLPHAQRLGGAAAADGTTAAVLHRGWIDLKSKLRHGDAGIVVEAARGDGITLHVFKDAVQGMLPPDARELVERQLADVSVAHVRILSLGADAPSRP
jgi:uncharacterized protein (TIGR02284 family)